MHYAANNQEKKWMGGFENVTTTHSNEKMSSNWSISKVANLTTLGSKVMLTLTGAWSLASLEHVSHHTMP